MSDDDDFMQDSDNEEYGFYLNALGAWPVLTILDTTLSTRTMMARMMKMSILRTNITTQSRSKPTILKRLLGSFSVYQP